MSRSGYVDDQEQWDYIRWRGRVSSAIKGRRGQRLLLDLVQALDALPEKRLITDKLILDTGDVCALGAVGLKRGILMWPLNPDDEDKDYDPDFAADELEGVFDASACLIREIQFLNDEGCSHVSPEERWRRVRAWAVKRLKPVDLVDLPE